MSSANQTAVAGELADDSESVRIAKPRFRLPLLHIPLWALVIAPAIFFIAAVQHSAIVFPFWDHCELIKYFAKLHDHTLHLADLWAPHNHARPFIFRLLLLSNGLLTHWDIRSEFIYLIGSVVIAFLVQAWGLWKLCGAVTLRFLILLSALSFLAFSPAGHNNHWWSFMIVLDLAHTFIVIALVTVSFAPRSWRMNLLAALACWLATYTVSNGLVAFLAVALTVQFSSRRLTKADLFTAFWALNIVAVLAVYLPGLAEKGGGLTDLRTFLTFCLAYLGSPVASLIAYPYKNMFDVPIVTARNAFTGAVLLGVAAFVFFRLKGRVERSNPALLLFASFSLFAIGSAMLTGLGRAEYNALGAANANASRYTIFGSYLAYGLLFSAASERKIRTRSEPSPSKSLTPLVSVLASLVFFALSVKSYSDAWPIYDQSHDFNQTLAAALIDNDPSLQKNVYPNLDVLKGMEFDLRRLKIGPFRFVRPVTQGGTEILAGHKLFDQFGVDGLRDMPPLGQVLFANPKSSFGFSPPGKIRTVHIQFGIVDTAVIAKPPIQGVLFRVTLKRSSGAEEVLWSRTLRPVTVPEDRGVQSADLGVDCSPADQLRFETIAVGDPIGCWAYWRRLTTD